MNREIFSRQLPEVTAIALDSRSETEFKSKLTAHVKRYASSGEETDAVKQLRLFLEYEGTTVPDFARGGELHIQTLTLLWKYLTGNLLPDEASDDLFLDLFHQFKPLETTCSPTSWPSAQMLDDYMSRWPSGTDEAVQKIREENKLRMIPHLITKIEQRNPPLMSFHFKPEQTYEEKYHLVSREWWYDYRFQLVAAAKTPTELNTLLGESLSEETMRLLAKARQKKMPFFVTPYYLSLLDITGEAYDDQTLRAYILYTSHLVEAYGTIRAWEKEDQVEPGKPNAAGWMLPEGNNIHRRYPDVAILIPDTMGRSCGGLCASCQRMYDFQSHRLNFELDNLTPKESWKKKLQRLMDYFEEDRYIKDILITGGDALMSQNKTLRTMLDAVYRMAIRKQQANLCRKEGDKYAELRRVRLGTRLPVYLPGRIDDELIDILSDFKVKAEMAGIQQFFIQTHFQTPLEVTPEACRAVRKLQSAGWLVTNQLVFNVPASRRGHTARLRQVLNRLGILCYYTFAVKGFEENYDVYAPLCRLQQEQREEKIFGRLTPEQETEIRENLPDESEEAADYLRRFMSKNRLPFLSTDRSVMNLPAIGKSMTFVTVGITPEGKRILRFKHDHTRAHSPVIRDYGDMYIAENKSVAAYLRQLEVMGENPDEYRDVWNACEGVTEKRFGLYEYPPMLSFLPDVQPFTQKTVFLRP